MGNSISWPSLGSVIQLEGERERNIQVFSITARAKTILSGVSSSRFDFKLEEKANHNITLEDIFTNTNVSFYNIYFKARRCEFVQTPSEVNIYQAPFLYEAQYLSAHTLISVPFEIIQEEVQKRLSALHSSPSFVPSFSFLFSTGRCGSTLLSRILDTIPGVQNLAEPDAFTGILGLAREDRSNEETIITLLKFCVDLFLLKNKEKHIIFKFRSELNVFIPYFSKLFPDSKLLFMYRNGDETIKSLYRAAFFWGPAVEQEHNQVHLRRLFPVLRFFKAENEKISANEAFAVFWLSSIDFIFGTQKNIYLTCIRYETLLEKPEQVITELCKLLNIPSTQLQISEACKTLQEPSQKGSDLFENSKLTSQQEQQLKDILKLSEDYMKRHPFINSFNFQLPNTLLQRESRM